MRYAYAITGILLAGGATATLALQQPVGAQVAQNAPTVMPQANAPGSFADLTERLAPAVVNISTTQTIEINQRRNPFQGSPFDEFFRQFGPRGGDNNGEPITRQARSLGSGFIISADGFIVTNNHVISSRSQNGGVGADPVDTITVTLSDRTEYEARIVGRDPATDLAVLKIEGENLPFVEFGDSNRLRVGDWVLAIGNPFGLGGTVTAGIVSAMQRNIGQGPYDQFIQTDASINQGNSGGPMFDTRGNVVGINSSIFSPTGGNVGIGFAIPASEAAPIVETLMRGERVRRGYLGVSIQPIGDDEAEALGIARNRGEIVARVEPGEAAAEAGIQQGDVIVEVNGEDVTPDQTLSYIVANLPVGQRVPIVLIRDGRRVRVTAVMGERPTERELLERAQQQNGQQDDDSGLRDPGKDEEQDAVSESTMESIGLGFQTLTPQIARQLGVRGSVRGIVINQVDPSSDAAQKGIRRGDIILSINRRSTEQPSDAVGVIDAARRAGRGSVLLLLQRGNTASRFIAIDIAE
ncbi:MAG: Do family serine endopeptidase [Sphingomonadaceae bacterium]|nr:Do family serine endopeptidase [Sphingomonadaceae bacterium]